MIFGGVGARIVVGGTCHNGRLAAISAKMALKILFDKSDLYCMLNEQVDGPVAQ